MWGLSAASGMFCRCTHIIAVIILMAAGYMLWFDMLGDLLSATSRLLMYGTL